MLNVIIDDDGKHIRLYADDQETLKDVAERSVEIFDKFGTVSVLDLYEICGVTTSNILYSNENRGWVNLKYSHIGFFEDHADNRQVALFPDPVDLNKRDPCYHDLYRHNGQPDHSVSRQPVHYQDYGPTGKAYQNYYQLWRSRRPHVHYADSDHNEPDMVSHPPHYQSATGLEVIDVIDAFTADLTGIEATDTGNILKYACRWKKKNGVEDLKKIVWYAQHLINKLENNKKENI